MTQTSTENYPQQLSTLKRKLKDQAMSLLIGAGFSKNFDKDIFPNWWELIFEMVREGLEPELADRFRQLYPKAKTKSKAYEEFLKQRIEKYIENTGPLEAVSEFIRRKGYREAVDIRIENKTPYIDLENGQRYINYRKDGKPKREPVTPDQMLIHEKVVALPWNNIYTTNYDNLLEKSTDIAIAAEFETAIEELSEDIEQTAKDLKAEESTLEALQDEIDQLQESIDRAKAAGGPLPLDPGAGTDEKRLKELIPKRANQERKVAGIKEDLNNKNERLAGLKRDQDLSNSPVTYSSQLALKKNGNIIKLHGSVRTGDSSEYGFDNDARMHYVISKEDFASYPVKHEAFTQLMRISLLQESFCLLGFSGIDPNFLAWIGWVRDIIEKKKAPGDHQEEKIYLIDVGSKPAEAEKAQFHLNHRIAFIPLGESHCRTFLEAQTGRNLPPDPDPKELVGLFLDYLSADMIPGKLKMAFEKIQQEEYLQLWRKYAWRATPDGKIDNFFLYRKTDKYLRLAKYNRIPANAYILQGDRYDIIDLLGAKLQSLKDDPGELSKLISFYTRVLEEQYLRLRDVFGNTPDFSQLLELAKKTGHEKYPSLLLVEFRDAVWTNDGKRIKKTARLLSRINQPAIQQEFSYLRVLRALFNLRFTEAKDFMAAWEPEGHWVMKKAGVLLLTDRAGALELLRSTRQDTLQETVYQLQLMGFIAIALGKFPERTRLNSEAAQLTHDGLRDAGHNLDQLLEKLNRNEQKIVPYGYDTYTSSRTMSFGGSNEWALAQMFFRILAETGFPLAVQGVTFRTSTDVHAAMFEAYRVLPFPVLFYLLQYSDEKFIIKMAQDYCASTDLDIDYLPIFSNIRDLFFDFESPIYMRQNGLTFLSELINVIQPKEWEPFFNRAWNELQQTKSLFLARYAARNYFLEKAIHLIQEPQSAARVINDCLLAIIQNDPADDQASVIRYLYELNFNETLKKKGNAINALIDAAAVKTLTEATSGNLELLFVLGNIHFALNENQRKAITEALRSLDTFESLNERIWRIVLYFAAGEPATVARIKDAILQNQRLWDAGFTENGVGGTNNYISIYQLRSRTDGQGIQWNRSDLQVLYEKLKDTLNKIEDWLNRHGDQFSSFKAILEEMTWFLGAEQESLAEQEDYAQTRGKAKALFTREKGYDKFIEGLVSGDKEAYTTAQNELFYQLYNFKKAEDFDFEIRTVLHKVLLRSEPGLAEALGSSVDWYASLKDKAALDRYGDLFLQILLQYRIKLPQAIDLPFLENKLIQLARQLKKAGYTDPATEEELTLLQTSRFMETRYNLRQSLDE